LIFRQLAKSFYIARKDIRAYYLKPPLITWGLMFPAVIILAMYLKDPQGIQRIAPGLVAMTLLFGNTSMAAIVVTFEKRIGALERLLLAPVSRPALIGGKVMSAAAFGLLTSTIVSVGYIIIFKHTPLRPALLALMLLLTALLFASLGTFISLSVKEVFEAMTICNYVRFPLIFVSGVFTSITILPRPLLPFAYISPLSYAVDGVRQSFGGEGTIFPFYLDIVLLAAYGGLFFALAVWGLKRRIQKEY
jgi:ABC-2 type transport system permease protein